MSAVALKSDALAGSKPRYQALAAVLREGILRGDFPDPANFPTESSLCAQYGVSRFTVREALRALQTEGLIQRRRGSGTRIQPAAARGGALHQPLSNVGEILQYANDTSFNFIPHGMMTLPKRLAVHTGTLPGQKWFNFRGIRTTREGERISLVDAYIHSDFTDIIDEIRPNEATIFRQLERLSGVPVARVTQDIQAVAMSAPIAAELNLPRRTPCLRILRGYLDGDGRIMEMSVNHHPGDKFAYSMHIDVDR